MILEHCLIGREDLDIDRAVLRRLVWRRVTHTSTPTHTPAWSHSSAALPEMASFCVGIAGNAKANMRVRTGVRTKKSRMQIVS
jgi:hypothetical protein